MTLEATDIEELEMRLFLEAIYVRYGYDLRGYAPESLKRRVFSTIDRCGFRHLGELQHSVLTDPALFVRVLGMITIPVSAMFRDPSFYLAFRKLVVPRLRELPVLNIWHAGCATGEEVYATAIVLHEEGLYDRTHFYATDISPAALEQAKHGVYSMEKFPEFARDYKESGGVEHLANYLTEAYGSMAMDASLRRNVFFFPHDLVSDHVFGEMDVIFCRNVLIYFGKGLRQQVLQKLSESLNPHGFLCLGASERLLSFDRGSFGPFCESERIYKNEVGAQ
jgi:chemotaxis protein methyltransferase CheR